MRRHLDSEYRGRFLLYRMADTRVFDSRHTNWREIDWENVISITAHMVNNSYQVSIADKAAFKCFMNFRKHGNEPYILPNGKQYYTIESGKKVLQRRDIHKWCIGWTDGHLMYYKEIDFANPLQCTDKVEKLDRAHIHPRIIQQGLM